MKIMNLRPYGLHNENIHQAILPYVYNDFIGRERTQHVSYHAGAERAEVRSENSQSYLPFVF